MGAGQCAGGDAGVVEVEDAGDGVPVGGAGIVIVKDVQGCGR